MKQDEFSTTRPTLKRWSNNWIPMSSTKDRASSTNQLNRTVLGRSHRRAIKESSKVVNRDWVNNQAYGLSHKINAVSGSFISNGYFPKLIRKIIPINHFIGIHFTSSMTTAIFTFETSMNGNYKFVHFILDGKRNKYILNQISNATSNTFLNNSKTNRMHTNTN